MKPIVKTALKVVAAAVTIVVVVGGGAAYLGMKLKGDPNQLALGAAAPKVELVDSEGQPFALSTLTAQGLPVLVFYRGHW